ncbi:hypothetical protein MCUN1_002389 [Malassezia cuniculi]|uniref:Uncharacterized protein n=1 Tax=Malassezia cuniculi TaxID=948313 RepID=A0AAF0J6S5_9BASI|nr:hypothetical protein MCUN1_002389 [Malassezia cuniculi]
MAAETLARVRAAFDSLAPTRLAGSWDNVGLIAESPVAHDRSGVFLAVDLSPAVADELLARDDIAVAVVYHPVIFAATKSLTLAKPLQASILRCIAQGISIYCPHTCLDVIDGGINDWLIGGLSLAWEDGTPDADARAAAASGAGSTAIQMVDDPRNSREGAGRFLDVDCTWGAMIQRVKAHLDLPHVQVAPARGVSADSRVTSVAVCAGSGGSVLAGTKADVWVTGELGHHEVLAANAAGISVILTNHTNTERGYIRSVLPKQLGDLLPGHAIVVSQADADPLTTA